MSLNKQVVISVPLTVTISDKAESEFIRGLVVMTKKVLEGDPEMGFFEKHLVRLAAEKGPESAMEAVLQKGITEMLREELHNKAEGYEGDDVRYRLAPPTFNWKV